MNIEHKAPSKPSSYISSLPKCLKIDPKMGTDRLAIK